MRYCLDSAPRAFRAPRAIRWPTIPRVAHRFSPSPADRSDVERVKDASDIVRLIGEHIALKPKGREYAGLCPFHDDRSPSMQVSPDKQIYKCFSCGAGGDVLTFAQKFLKMEFRESLEYLAERAGVQLTQLRSSSPRLAGGVTREDLLRVHAQAAACFQAFMQHAEHGAATRALLERRGITHAMIESFKLGAAPNRWDGLLLMLQGKGVGSELLVAGGLAKAREHGQGCYDAFRNRLMFPICDAIGRVVAFGARRIDDADEPKYLNSSESPIFEKSKTLYALHLASRSIQQQRTAIICEGYTDVIACHQAGVTNAVATLGTALTREHAKVLRRICDRVVLLFDGDQAGQRAADRAAEVFFAEPLDVGIVALSRHTDAKDPDELLKRPDGAAIFRLALDAPIDLLRYRFERLRERLAGAGDAALAKGVNEEIAQLVELGLAGVEPIRKQFIVRQLAILTGVSEATIQSVIPAGRPVRASLASEPQREPTRLALQSATLREEEYALGCLLCDGSLWVSLLEQDKDALAPSVYRDDVLREIAQAVHLAGEEGREPSLRGVLPDLAEHADASAAAVTLMARVEEQTSRDVGRVRALWSECLHRLRQARAEVRVARESGDDATARLQSMMTMRTTMGPDLRRVPRPSGPATPRARTGPQMGTPGRFPASPGGSPPGEGPAGG
jgi:DNA primase